MISWFKCLFLNKKKNKIQLVKSLRYCDSIFYVPQVNIIFKSYDSRILEPRFKAFVFNFLLLCPGILNMDIGKNKLKINQKLTLNRSPFVNKQSKDQFEVRFSSISLSFTFNNLLFLKFFYSKFNKNLFNFIEKLNMRFLIK